MSGVRSESNSSNARNLFAEVRKKVKACLLRRDGWARAEAKIESSEVMLGPFISASSSRLDPCSTCSRCFPCGDAARDLRSGSGLTANRINLPNASELYPAFDFASRSPRPALSYRPLLTLLFYILQCEKVIALEPRTPHQPEKLKKLSKNDSVLLFSFSESIKSWRF